MVGGLNCSATPWQIARPSLVVGVVCVLDAAAVLMGNRGNPLLLAVISSRDSVSDRLREGSPPL